MTIHEMAKIYKRVCRLYENDYCEACPLLPRDFGDGSAEDCLDAMIKFPDEFEQELLNWSKANPAQTNREKFFELFNCRNYRDNMCKIAGQQLCELPCNSCDWWDEEYIEPESDGE